VEAARRRAGRPRGRVNTIMTTQGISRGFAGPVSVRGGLFVAGWLAVGLLVASSAAQQSALPDAGSRHESGAQASTAVVGGAPAAADSSAASEAPEMMPVVDMTADTLLVSPLRWPDIDGSCYVYPHYIVIAWGSPDPQPVAIVRKREPGGGPGAGDCSADSLPGDFVLRNDWAEYFCGMWRDLLFIDSGTGDIRSLILYDVPTRCKVLELEGAGEMAGWIDEVTVRIWLLSGTDLPRSVCPDIPEMLGVGVDSLYALNLETFRLTPLGPWRCHALQ
jgi:hypothetical protein